MSARDGKSATLTRTTRRVSATVSPLPPPEEIFIDWLMSVPCNDVLEAAARYQIEMIDRSPVAANADVRVLRALLAAVAGDCDWPPVPNL